MSVGVVVYCDAGNAWGTCTGLLPAAAVDVATARRKAAAAGWRHLNGRDLCPRHRDGEQL